MKVLIYKLYFLSIILTSFCAQAQKYTIEDLKILHKQKSYLEYLNHALDVVPSKRDKSWEEMTGEMALHYLEAKIKDPIVSKEVFNKIESLNHIPILKNNTFFQLRRAQYAKAYFLTIDLNKDTNINEFLRFWSTSTKYANLSYDLYKKNFDNETIAKLTIPVFVKSSGAGLYCKDSTVLTNIFKMTHDINIKKYISNIQKITKGECLNTMADSIKRKYLFSNNSYYSDIAYNLLIKSKNLDKDEEDYFFAMYILNGPVVGNIFNKAWNRLSLLSQDYNRRKALLKKLTSHSTLPGSIFSHPDKNKRKVLTKFFVKNFPEYIDYYTKSCTQFYAGEKRFEFGNPTPNCDDLMKLSIENKWISDRIKIKYSSSKKL